MQVRYPLTREQEHADRAGWPWLPGWVVSVCGPDEWVICVQAPELATWREGEDWYQNCFRDSELSDVGLELPADAHVFSNDPMGASPWNPDWATHNASDLSAAAGVKLNIKGLLHYTASQLLAARFDLRNTAARHGHGSGGATTLRHYADSVSEVTGEPPHTSHS